MTDAQTELVKSVQALQWQNIEKARSACGRRAEGESFGYYAGFHSALVRVLEIIAPPEWMRSSPTFDALIRAVKEGVP